MEGKYVVIEDDTCWVILCPREKDIKCFSEPLSNWYVIFSEVMTIQGLIELKDKKRRMSLEFSRMK